MTRNNLPPGWGDRHNKMSEHDLKLGGMAATKFAKNSYSDKPVTAYNSSDQVRDFYLNESQNASKGAKNNSNVPDFWESRQKQKELQAKQMGVFARDSVKTPAQYQASPLQPSSNDQDRECKDGTDDSNDVAEPEVAILEIATHALETLTKSLKKRKVSIPLENRASFAKAMKNAMDALAES